MRLYSGDKLVVVLGMHLENIGIITNNGGEIYNYGTIMTDEFSVIYNNGTVTTSGGTINNYASIYNYHGSIGNYGTVYNYGTIYNYNDSTIDDRYGVIYNNGTINNDCDSVFKGNVPYGNQVRNVCSTIQSPLPMPPAPLPQSLTNPTSPLKQFNSGIRAKDVICKQGFQLIIKAEDSYPACVKPETAQKLVERGWGTKP